MITDIKRYSNIKKYVSMEVCIESNGLGLKW